MGMPEDREFVEASNQMHHIHVWKYLGDEGSFSDGGTYEVSKCTVAGCFELKRVQLPD